ncbi:MAG: hypothetical protein EBT00_14870 [Proteobacteria bacterium]|nr:hypothetical protein [Pseudomonadota bacterium]
MGKPGCEATPIKQGPRFRKRGDVMLVDRRKRFQRCPSGPMDCGGGLQGPDIGAAEDQVQMAHSCEKVFLL